MKFGILFQFTIYCLHKYPPLPGPRPGVKLSPDLLGWTPGLLMDSPGPQIADLLARPVPYVLYC